MKIYNTVEKNILKFNILKIEFCNFICIFNLIKMSNKSRKNVWNPTTICDSIDEIRILWESNFEFQINLLID